MKLIRLSLFSRFLIAAGFSSVISNRAFSQLELSSPNTSGNYTAPVSIVLKPGFSTAPGQSFSAKITAGCTPLATALSNNQNYVVTYTPLVAGIANPADPNNTTCQVKASIEYFDGLGRPMQTVQVKGSPTLRDIVQPIAYDQFGREATKYQAYSAASSLSNGSYKADALSQQASFYSNPIAYNAPNVVKTNFPFAETSFEASPLNRVVEQGAPGDNWQLTGKANTSSPGHTVKLEQATNDASSLTAGSGRWAKLYSVALDANGRPSLTDQGSYGANQLYVTIYKDENWKSTNGKGGTTEEYTDKEGRVVLKRAFNSTTKGLETLSTYYVYDDFGNLTYVLPPKAEPDNGGITQTILNNLCYQYRFDERNRSVEKKLPSKGWDYFIYNKLDQVVATQDSMQRVSKEWTFIKYDALGRPVLSGIYNNGGATINRVSLQSQVNSQSKCWEDKDNTNVVGKYYTVNTFPTSGIKGYLSISYYDDYDIPNLPSTYDLKNSFSKMTRSLPTASLSNVLGTSDMLWTVLYYDDNGRAVKTINQHYLNGSLNVANYDEMDTKYDFTDNVTSSTRSHHASNLPLLTVRDSSTYDHIGRKILGLNQINGGGLVVVVKNDYNEIGQLMAKHLHSTDNGNTYLQDISYKYNERGWMVKDSSRLFVQQLKYNDGTNPQFNGNVSNQLWGTGSNLTKNYTYAYDNLNRLISGVSNENFTEQGIDYDKVGNIQHLTRIDPRSSSNITYTYNYNGNQLQNVTNLTTSNYQYDGNGNTVFDAHNNVNISYNILNLPKQISGSKSVNYTYEAGGKKLRRVSANTTVGSEDYINGIQYHNGAIAFITNEEGLARRNPANNTYSYEYTLTDHIGNNRVSFDDSSHVARLIQKDDYFPFGLNYNRYTFGSKNNYLFNKKEWQEETGTYDYGARFYDPTIARWGTIDPLAEKYFSDGSYNYVSNNPVSRIDPDGRDWRSKGDSSYAAGVKKDVQNENTRLGRKANDIQNDIAKANSGEKKFKTEEKKAEYLAKQNGKLSEINDKMAINNETVSRIDAMTNSKQFTFGFDHLAAGAVEGGTLAQTQTVNGTSKTVYMMRIVSEGNAVHEMTHGYQGTIGGMFTFNVDDSAHPVTFQGANPYAINANSEIEAYKAQYAFDNSGFPTSQFTGSAKSLSSINDAFVGGITVTNQTTGTTTAIYPNVMLRAISQMIFSHP